MSIIVAFVSREGWVVASDGRIFTSAKTVGGQVVQAPPIESDECDKTFFCWDGLIVGAHADLMRFCGKTVGEHVVECLHAQGEPHMDVVAAADAVEKELCRRLEGIDAAEVGFDRRKVDLLLVGYSGGNARFPRIAALHFESKDQTIIARRELVSGRKDKRFYLYGNPEAQIGASRVFRSSKAPNRDVAFLRSLACQAVSAGIQSSGTYPQSSSKCCGGKVSTRALSARKNARGV